MRVKYSGACSFNKVNNYFCHTKREFVFNEGAENLPQIISQQQHSQGILGWDPKGGIEET
jgi:hypothetical protein